MVVGSAIGSGIFRSPAGIADRIPGPFPLISMWVVGGLISLCGALTLAEVASEVPKTGGIYAFLKEAWGKLPAFLFGWAQLTVVRAAALGAISITFAEYFWRVWGFDPTVAPYDQYARYTAAVAPADLGLDGSQVGEAGSRLEIVSVQFPQSGRGAQILEGDAKAAAAALVDKLRKEARVL